MQAWKRIWLPWAALVVAVSIGVGLLIVLEIKSISNLEARNDWVVHSHQVLDQTKGIVSALGDAESAGRGYALTGRDDFLKKYHEAPDLIDRGLDGLKSLTRDNPSQEARIVELQAAIAAKVDRMNELVSVRRSGGIDAVEKLAAGKQRPNAMDRVRSIANDIVTNESGLLATRTDQALRSVQQAREIGVLSILLMAGLVSAAFFGLAAMVRGRRRFRQLVASIGDGFYSLDSRWRFIHFNEAAERLTGLKATETLGFSILDVFPRPIVNEAIKQYSDVMKTKRPIVFISTEHSRDRSIECRVFPSEDGISVFLHDITDRIRADHQIKELNESLEQRVLDRTAQLDGFCHSIAHDMRMHIRGVSANAALLVDDVEHGRTNLRGRLERLNQSTERMADLVDDLLSFARNSAQTLDVGEADLSAEASAIADRLRTDEVYARDVQFIIRPDLRAKADPQLAAVVLLNLLDNACKFRTPGPDVFVEFGESEVDGRRAFFVRDNGRGFDQEYASRMFKPFERLHRELAIPGSGIGLANAKRILERHGGAIWAEGQRDKGSTFYFTFGEAPPSNDSEVPSSLSSAYPL